MKHPLAKLSVSLLNMIPEYPDNMIDIVIAARNIALLAEADLLYKQSSSRIYRRIFADIYSNEGDVEMKENQERIVMTSMEDIIEELRRTSRDVYDILRSVERLNREVNGSEKLHPATASKSIDELKKLSLAAKRKNNSRLSRKIKHIVDKATE